MSIVELLNRINALILNPLIGLVFAISSVVFVWGIIEYIRSETADAKREQGNKKIIYGLVGMFIMFSAFGIIRLILQTFSIPNPGYPFN